MPPDGYTTVTVWDETAAKLAEFVVSHDIGSVAEAIDFVSNTARKPEILSESVLTRLFHEKSQTESGYSNLP